MKRVPVPLKMLWVALFAHVFWLRTSDAYGDQGMRNVFSFMSVALGLVVHWAWLLWAGGLDRGSRRRWLWTPPMGLLLFFSTVRFDGYSGYMIPDLSWRWTTPEAPRELGSGAATGHAIGAAPSPLDYPGFLGQDRQGRADGVKLVPDWRTHPPQLLWRQAVGKGWSGFAVQGELAVTMEEREGTTGLYA